MTIQHVQFGGEAHTPCDAVMPVSNPEILPQPPTEKSASFAWPQKTLMADAWKNRGALEPSEALETLFWAKEGADVRTLVSLIDFSVFTESELQEAANCFAGVPQDKRTALGIATLEEFIALAWAVSGNARFNGAVYVNAKSTTADEVELRVQLFGKQDALGSASFSGNHPFVFHRTLDGWQWRMQPHNISATKHSWAMMVGLPLRSRMPVKGPTTSR